MVRFAHLADTHLGYRQYGLEERETDFYKTFTNLIDDIITENPDFIIHSGDLFETNRPSTRALYTFQNALEKLNKENIPIYAIPGNHDISLKKDSLPPQVLYRLEGLNLISPNSPYYTYEDIFIGGIPYTPLSHKNTLKDNIEIIKRKAEEYKTKILVLHQGIDKYMPYGSELEIGELPENFNYYAMGHLHNYINNPYGEGCLVYPGSSEIWKTSEIGDYKKHGKGYVIATIDENQTSVERKTVNISREFINKTIEYQNLFNELQDIKNSLLRYGAPPIINITVTGDKFKTTSVYEKIHQELDNYALLVRPTCEFDKEMEILDNEKIGTLDPKRFLDEHFQDSQYPKAGDFVVDLFDKLSHGKREEAESLVDTYYKETFTKKQETKEE